ncbi:MAG TPA: tRNA pseudouridine(38-40) synthase TruA [Candidatus Omnitrophota bacterium]|nr:tRNA pseudouridine(38-40) synthase TruA [Candidatus Omnitrophota bacterium]
MLRNIKLTIEYDGRDFKGWQTQAVSNAQAPAKEQRTVQNEIEKVLKKLFKRTIHLIGSGRTDSGVHALGQVANFKTTSVMPVEKMQRALNANLPADIAVIKAEDVSKDFHARYHVKSKTYRYTILNRPGRCALQKNFVLHCPHKLNLRSMREEAKFLVGRHDFKSFAASPAKEQKIRKINTVRTIKRLVIAKKGDFIQCDIEANGFLYRMVRNIIGTLLDIGSGKTPRGSIKRILAQKDRTKAGATAQPHGLALLEVKY